MSKNEVGWLAMKFKEEIENLRLEYIFKKLSYKNTNCMCFYIMHKYTSEKFHATGQINLISNPV